MRSLDEVLAVQRGRDLLGPDPTPLLRRHSLGFAVMVEGLDPAAVLDLGSGGGVPGLVLAVEAWPASRVTLLDASQRRATYLELCIVDLALGPRVEVVVGRAEDHGRTELRRGGYDVVVARSFGPPAALAECAAPFLAVGGVLVVSEPPGRGGDRWPAAGIARLGLVVEETRHIEGAGYTRMRQVQTCPALYPRRPGVPERRPLF